MRSKIKKQLCALLSLVMALSCFGTALWAFAEDEIAINESNFPDPVWRAYVQENYDDDSNGALSAEERSVTGMLLSYLDDEISDLSGIEYFTSLKTLRCSSLGLTSLDVSRLTELTVLVCSGNELSSLDLSKNTKLLELRCSDNDSVTSLDLSKNTALKTLECYNDTSLSSLNVKGLTALETLRCYNDNLSSVDFSTNTALANFNASHNHFADLDLSATAIDPATNYQVGNQTAGAVIEYSNGLFSVPFALQSPDRLVATGFDTEEALGYSNGAFFTDSFENVTDELEYTYNTGLENASPMDVTIALERGFYQVNFYSDENMNVLLQTSYVNAGDSAQAPDVTSSLQCKAVESWSEDLTSVNADLSVYPNIVDNHSYSLIGFKESTGVATIKCSVCANTYTVNFIDCVNKGSADSGYEPCLDLTGDGFINAKDYARLIKAYATPKDDNDVVFGQ